MYSNYSKKYNKKNAKPVFSETGRVIGQVENSTFKKRIRGSIHILQVPPGIAFDIYAIEQAERYGAIQAEVIDTETGTIYRAPLQLIREKGLKFNRGFGSQIALPLPSWTTNRKSEPLQKRMQK